MTVAQKTGPQPLAVLLPSTLEASAGPLFPATFFTAAQTAELHLHLQQHVQLLVQSHALVRFVNPMRLSGQECQAIDVEVEFLTLSPRFYTF